MTHDKRKKEETECWCWNACRGGQRWRREMIHDLSNPPRAHAGTEPHASLPTASTNTCAAPVLIKKKAGRPRQSEVPAARRLLSVTGWLAWGVAPPSSLLGTGADGRGLRVGLAPPACKPPRVTRAGRFPRVAHETGLAASRAWAGATPVLAWYQRGKHVCCGAVPIHTYPGRISSAARQFHHGRASCPAFPGVQTGQATVG